MLKCVINIEATTEEEIQYTLQEVMRKLEAGNLAGMDAREDGITKYDFDISGEESPYIECPYCEENTYYEGDKPTTCDGCGKAL